jgi:hypothetical protein
VFSHVLVLSEWGGFDMAMAACLVAEEADVHLECGGVAMEKMRIPGVLGNVINERLAVNAGEGTAARSTLFARELFLAFLTERTLHLLESSVLLHLLERLRYQR